MLLGAQMAREDGLRSLHGAMGAAALFGRGRRYGALAQVSRYERLPGALRQLLVEPVLFGLGGRLPGAFARMRERIEASLAPAPVRLRRRNRLLRQGAAGVVDPAFPGTGRPGSAGRRAGPGMVVGPGTQPGQPRDRAGTAGRSAAAGTARVQRGMRRGWTAAGAALSR
nr:hypothetical protein [Massilia sp. Dwa41.01b]